MPVCRLVHHERSFVITFPNAYHAGFNTGASAAHAHAARCCLSMLAAPEQSVWGGLQHLLQRLRTSRACSGSPPYPAGTNCAEAVNFGPPDWLPWGHYVQEKYTRDGKAATLSNDALLVALAKAAPLVRPCSPGVRCIAAGCCP